MVKPSGEVIAGHTRLIAARELAAERVPIVRFEGSDLEAIRLRSFVMSRWARVRRFQRGQRSKVTLSVPFLREWLGKAGPEVHQLCTEFGCFEEAAELRNPAGPTQGAT